MRKITYFCDRCGKETPANANSWVSFSKSTSYQHNVSIMLCDSCHESFLNFINAKMEVSGIQIEGDDEND